MVLAFAASALVGASAEVYFEEDFSAGMDAWTPAATPGKEMGKWIVSPGKWFVDEKADAGLQVTEDMRFHSITAPLKKKASSKGKDIVLQFSAKIENHQYAFCGGGYIKLLPEGTKVETFGGDDEYAIMFGPDLCGCAAPGPLGAAEAPMPCGGPNRPARPPRAPASRPAATT